MNFKIPFKALTTTALIGTLALSAVTPSIAQAATDKTVKASDEAAYQTKDLVFTKEGSAPIQISVDEYAKQLLFGDTTVLNGYKPGYVVTNNGKSFDYDEFVKNLLFGTEGATQVEVLEQMDKDNQTTELPSNVQSGSFNDKGELVGENVEAELKVESISAINNKTFEFQVSFNQDVAEAKPATLKLNDVTVVAQPTKTEGKVVTYTVKTEDQDKLVTGNYAVTIDGVKAISQTANYEKLVTETSITGVAVESNETDGVYADLEAKQLAGVTATVDGKSVTTNAFGYFNFGNVAPGKKEIVFKKSGYFTHRATVDTKRSNETSYAAELEQRVKAKYAIEGTIVNAENSQPVADGVEVTLQREVNGEWVDVKDAAGEAYTAKTKSGKYAFVNSKDAKVTADASATQEVYGALDYAEDGSIKYRVVANKDIAADNFTEVYDNQVSSAFTLSDEKATTTPTVFKANKVKEIKDLNLAVTWNDLAKETAKTVTDLKVSLINEDGETVLVSDTDGTLTKVKEEDKATLKDEKSINLVDKGIFKENGSAVTPRLPVGTYFLKVDDDQLNNATPYVAVKVTEEGQVVNLAAEVTEAANLTPSVSVPSVKYNAVFNLDKSSEAKNTDVTDKTLKAANVDDFNGSSEAVTTTVKTFLTIDGHKVRVDEETKATGFNYTKATKTVSTSAAKIDRLPAGKYSVTTAEGKYVSNDESSEVSLSKGGSTNKTVEVSGLGKATIEVVKEADPTKSITELSKVELLDAATGEVVDTHNAVYNNTTGAITNGAETTFENIEPGEYKVKVSAPGYESKTSDKFTVYDFQNVEEAAKVQLKEGEEFTEPVVQGIALFADDNTAVKDATITAYNKAGKFVSTAIVDAKGAYTFNDDLAAGETYKLVLRLDGGAETTVQEVTVPTASKSIKTVDFTNVVKGGEAKYEVIIVDEKNREVNLTGANVYLKDEFAAVNYATNSTFQGLTEPSDDDVAAAIAAELPKALSTTDNDGFVALTAGAKNLYSTKTKLSAGAHTIVVEEGSKTQAYTATVSIQKDATVDGGIIKLKLKGEDDGNLTYDVSGKVTGTQVATNAAANGYVLAISTKDNSVVASAPIANDGTYKLEALPNNTAYRLITVANAKDATATANFVASKVVTVQDRDLTGQDITVTPASR